MKFLLVTDTHLRGTTPRCRRDDLPQTLENKIYEIGGLAHEHQVEAVLHAGDMWDTPVPAVSVAARFLTAWRNALSGTPMLVLPGNHDEVGHNPNLINRTMLGLGAYLGVYDILHSGPVVFNEGDLTVQVTGAPYHYDIDKRDPLLDYTPQMKVAEVAIHIAHGMLLPEPIYPGAAFTPVSAIWDRTVADLTLVGHNHRGFPLIEHNGRLFYNPGSTGRVRQEDFNHHPVVVLIEVTRAGIKLTDIPLQTAPTVEDVFIPDAPPDPGEDDEARAARLRTFIEAVRRASQHPCQDVMTVLARVASESCIRPEVAQSAKARVSRIIERAQRRGESVDRL